MAAAAKASSKLVLTEPVLWGESEGSDAKAFEPGDECPSALADLLPEGYVVKESEYKKLIAETVEDDGDDDDDDDGA